MDWLLSGQAGSARPNGSHLCVTFRVREGDISTVGVQPVAVQLLGFRYPEPGQRQEPHNGKSRWPLTVSVGKTHGFSQAGNFIQTQAANFPLGRETAGTKVWVPVDHDVAHGMGKDALQRSNGASGHTRATCRHTSPTGATRFGSLAKHDILLHPFDIEDPKAADEAVSQQRLDVGLDPGFIPSKA